MRSVIIASLLYAISNALFPLELFRLAIQYVIKSLCCCVKDSAIAEELLDHGKHAVALLVVQLVDQ